MDENPHLARVAEAFGGAAGYDDSADIQRIVADMLADRIASGVEGAGPRILEIGCGTGFLTRALADRIGAADWTVSDVAPEMIARAEARLGLAADYRVLDGERIDPALGRFDLICSSLAFQWFADLPGAVARLSDLLAPGGLLAFATMAEGSFAEWRAAHAAEDLIAGTPAYPDSAALRALAPAGIDARIERIDVPRTEADARGFVRRLKTIGAGTPSPRHRPLSPAALRRVMARFDDGERTITYDIAFCFLRRPVAR